MWTCDVRGTWCGLSWVLGRRRLHDHSLAFASTHTCNLAISVTSPFPIFVYQGSTPISPGFVQRITQTNPQSNLAAPLRRWPHHGIVGDAAASSVSDSHTAIDLVHRVPLAYRSHPILQHGQL